MNALLTIIRTQKDRWQGCRPLSPAERMARYSLRHSQDMQQRENEGAGMPRVRVVDGHQVLVALPGRVNALPKAEADEAAPVNV